MTRDFVLVRALILDLIHNSQINTRLFEAKHFPKKSCFAHIYLPSYFPTYLNM